MRSKVTVLVTSRGEGRRKSTSTTQVGMHLSTQTRRGDQHPLSNIFKEDTKTDQTDHFKSIHTEPASLEVRSSNEKKKWQISVRILGVSWDMTFKF